MSEIKIRDLYTGKPDAKDEINFEGLEEFIKTFVVADHFQLDSLLYGNNCFITGFKGTGKTALLFYLDNKLKDEDPITCTSFIFFKEEFTDAKRDELQAISNRFLSSISVEPGALLNIREFEYIWRWLIFKRIVSDNEDNHRNLFVDDEFWDEFERKVNQIKAPLNKKKCVVLGTPIYLADLCSAVKVWLDGPALKAGLAGKVGGAFATADYLHGGGDLGIQTILNHMMVLGMLTYSGGGSFGKPVIHLGPVALHGHLEESKELFRLYGQRMATKTVSLFG